MRALSGAWYDHHMMTTTPAPLADRAARMTSAELRRLILIDRRRFRKTMTSALRDRIAARHAILMTELRSRNLT